MFKLIVLAEFESPDILEDRVNRIYIFLILSVLTINILQPAVSKIVDNDINKDY